MPGRVSTRTSVTSNLSRKSSAQALSSRRSTTSRITSPSSEIPNEGPSSTLRERISSVFGDAQKTTAGHRKLVVTLRKLQESCCYESHQRGEFGEDDFNVEVARCVIRIVAVKKAEGVGDRLVRFLGLFLRHASGKGESWDNLQR